ncbi:MAG: hypothetical protein JWQ72_2330 [Polaromonas sp.]|nr:hypothetical protein [Polaromonas sp.]
MAYMLLIVEDPRQRHTRTEAEGKAVYERMMRFGNELQASGRLLSGESLGSAEHGARVTVRGGRAQVVDGPFAEAKEMVGGFFLIDCQTWAEAVDIAQRCPAAEWATVEVRSLGPCYEAGLPPTVPIRP